MFSDELAVWTKLSWSENIIPSIDYKISLIFLGIFIKSKMAEYLPFPLNGSGYDILIVLFADVFALLKIQFER